LVGPHQIGTPGEAKSLLRGAIFYCRQTFFCPPALPMFRRPCFCRKQVTPDPGPKKMQNPATVDSGSVATSGLEVPISRYHCLQDSNAFSHLSQCFTTGVPPKQNEIARDEIRNQFYAVAAM